MRKVQGPAVLLLLLAGTAAAYVLPPSYVLNRYYALRDEELESFQIELETRLIGPQHEGGEQTVQERWSLGLPLKFRSEQELPRGTRIQLISRGKRLLLEPGKTLGESPALFDPLIHPFTRATVRGSDKTYKAGDLLLSDLGTAGIDTTTTGLTRMGERVAVIIGATEQQQDKSQLWIDKERFVPLRILLVEGTKDSPRLREVRYLNYPGIGGKHRWFPRTIEIRENGRLVQASEVKSISGKKRIDRALFDLEALRRLAREQATRPGPHDADGTPAAAGP